MNKIYVGVVESRQDKTKTGRCQVRIVGAHSSDITELPTEKLHWATTMHPTTSAGLSGIGSGPHGLVEGSTVLCMFSDEYGQQPIIIGSIPGQPVKPSDKNSNVGFEDKSGTYPFKPKIESSDLNNLIINNKTEETPLIDKTVAAPKDVEMPNDKKWSQPKDPYNTVYPYTNSMHSESGHSIELDDTYDAQRLNIAHMSGTYSEMNPDGSMTNRIRGDKIDVVEKSGIVYIKGAASVTIDGNAYVKINNALTVDIGGFCTVNILNDVNLNVSGSANLSVVDSLNIQASAINMESYFGDICIKSAADIYLESGKNIHMTSCNHTNIDTVPNLLNLNCGLAMKPKMNSLAIPKSRKYPKSPNVGDSGIK